MTKELILARFETPPLSFISSLSRNEFLAQLRGQMSKASWDFHTLQLTVGYDPMFWTFKFVQSRDPEMFYEYITGPLIALGSEYRERLENLARVVLEKDKDIEDIAERGSEARLRQPRFEAHTILDEGYHAALPFLRRQIKAPKVKKSGVTVKKPKRHEFADE